MKITPLDIYNKEFKKKFSLNGYDGQEVDEFLDHVAAAYERVLKELNQLRDENERLKSEITRYKEMEGTLKDTMVVAQETVRERKSQADREAEMIIEQAKGKANEMLTQAKERVRERMQQFQQIEEYEKFFRVRMKSILEGYLQLLTDNQIERPEEMDQLTKELAISAEKNQDDEEASDWLYEETEGSYDDEMED